MIHRLACSAVMVVALASSSSAAQPAPPLVVDPKGDWGVASQDIVSATVATNRAGHVVQTLTLAAPLAQVPGTYRFVFFRDECDMLVTSIDWRGPGLPYESKLEIGSSCSVFLVPPIYDPRPQVRQTLPVPVTVTGATITWTLPQVPELAKGTLLKHPVVTAAPNPQTIIGVYGGNAGLPAVAVEAFDIGYGRTNYVVGTRAK